MNWNQIADWFNAHCFFEAAQAARNPKSDLRRFGEVDLIAESIAEYEAG